MLNLRPRSQFQAFNSCTRRWIGHAGATQEAQAVDTSVDPPSDPLGPRVEFYSVSNANVVIGIVVGSMLIAGALGMAGCGLSRIPDIKSDKLAGGQILGGLVGSAVLGLFGSLGVWYARSLRGTGIEVCEKGIRPWPVRPHTPVFHWSEVVRIEERWIYDKAPMKLGGPFLSVTYRQFGIVHRDGWQLTIDRESISKVGRLGKRLREIATAHSIPWTVVGDDPNSVWKPS